MKVLITGSSGFIGSAVTRAVLAREDEVRVLIRPTSSRMNVEGLPVETVHGDLTDPVSLDKALKGCQGLYHVAAHYAFWDPTPQVFYDVNVNGTRNLLRSAANAGVDRIVYTSTIGAIGLPEEGGLGREDLFPPEHQLSGHYKRSKFLAEQMVLQMAREGLPVVIVNPSAPVGERDVKPTPTGQIIVDYLKGNMFAYIETGMNLIDVDDVAQGHLQAMKRGRIGERYILGNQNLTLQEIFEVLHRLTGVPAPRMKVPRRAVLPLAYVNKWVADWVTKKPPRIPLEGVKMAKYRMHYDCTKAQKEFDLPLTPIEGALEKAVRWFRQHGYA